ncbi:MAG: hypothetical protein WKF87_04120 [Chryseolinea sp.]
MTWAPISLDNIFGLIHETEKDLNGDLMNFWELIKVDPEKWLKRLLGKKEMDFG